jgi:hypothetical protein
MDNIDTENGFENLSPTDDFGVSSSSSETHHTGVEDLPAHTTHDELAETRASGGLGDQTHATSKKSSSCPAGSSGTYWLHSVVKHVDKGLFCITVS